MSLKVHPLIITALSILLVSFANAGSDGLPSCEKTACSDIFHDKKIDQATVAVWEGERDVITSQTFELDSSAVLVSESEFIKKSRSSGVIDEVPPAPCSSGACSEATTLAYEAADEIITVIMTFVYYDGYLIDVHPVDRRTEKPFAVKQ
ncbi:hypothetical protein [Idiomarina loihiensis]|uniref:Predicted secreted protein n=1 Tax=Idiomarina loihiensis (strain ATCC BAA-735 / DSM 15497 / L2-TR) TaxID=283942 RepID=Q5QTT3_IDILO|nr:hypothetical protein [Idiomarina loihiensis]AAV82011.1 Predicted secreted protein [Idiomarina loihiensis L2TR]AGM36041.1 hypothetical protein K734_05890 [Idiomarina loihiensis GSL 199]